VGNERILYMVVAMRCKGRVVLLIYCFIYYTCICVFGIFLCVSSISSPYLLVFGDDRVRGTREQVMMQVELVRLSRGEGMIRGSLCSRFLYSILNYDVKAHVLFD